MDDESGNAAASGSQGIPKPVIPPPNLNPPPPPPRSPLDKGPAGPPSSPPPPLPSGNGGARVNMRMKSDDDDDDAVSDGISFNTRISATVIDAVISTGLIVLLCLLLPDSAHKLAWLTGLAYMVVRDSLPFLGGQSVGKKAMKIQAVTLEGKSLVSDWKTSLIRNGPLIIPGFAFVELYILLNREEKPERGRRLGDEWAKTKVIVEPKPSVPEEIV